MFMGLQLQIAPGERAGGALNAQKMNYDKRKQQIVNTYDRSDRRTKRAITTAVFEYLQRREKVRATKQSLEQWRKTTANRSLFRYKYLAAYEHAIEQVLTPETA